MTQTEIANALIVLRPGAAWVVHGDTYDDIEWTDQVQIKPTLQEVQTAVASLAIVAATEAARRTDIRADSGRIDLLNRLQTATPAQIDTWLTNNVTNLAQARAVLAAIIKVIALDVRT